MKNYLCLFLLTLFASSFSSCKKDPCKDVNCNHGTCTTGTCSCESGYQGANCDTEIRAKLLGNWFGTITTNGSSNSYAITIKAGSGINDIVIDNLFFCSGVNTPLQGSLSGETISNLNATICNGLTYTFLNVIMKIENNNLTIQYQEQTILGTIWKTGTLTR